jgi:hypothetical protein
MSDRRILRFDAGTLGDERRPAPKRDSDNERERAGFHPHVSHQDDVERDTRIRRDFDDARCSIDEMPPIVGLDQQRWSAELSPDDFEND